MRHFLLSGIFLALPLVSISAPVPQGWSLDDYDPTQKRYTVKVGSFPSSVLAESIRRGLIDQGWRPTETIIDQDGATVILGDFDTAAAAEGVARDLAATRIANGETIIKPESASDLMDQVTGPGFPVYYPSPNKARETWTFEASRADLDVYSGRLDTAKAKRFQNALDEFAIAETKQTRGEQAYQIMSTLNANKAHPDAALFFASRLAAGDYSVPTEWRLEAAEIAADLLYGHLRDWAGAWKATNELMNDADRTESGKARDHLRRAALMVDLIKGGFEHAPSFGKVRQELRLAYSTAPETDRALLAKIDIFYLSTFAYEGDWERVRPLAHLVIGRTSDFPTQNAMARLWRARALETTAEYDLALLQLDEALNQPVNDSNNLYMGYELVDVKSRIREVRREMQRKSLVGTNDSLPTTTADQ